MENMIDINTLFEGKLRTMFAENEKINKYTNDWFDQIIRHQWTFIYQN